MVRWAKWVLLFLISSILLLDWYRADERILNLDNPEFLTDVGERSELNWDNLVFKPGLRFDYDVNFLDSLGRPSLLYVRKGIFDVTSGLLPLLSPRPKNSCLVDRISLEVFHNKGSTSLGESQTIVKYEYYQGSDRVYYGEVTGVVEDSTMIFLHPPRNLFFHVNQLAPFPYVKLPLTLNDTWQIDFSIPDHVFDRFAWLRSTDLKVAYVRGAQCVENVMGHQELVTEFKATASNDEIISTSEYYFHERYGFVEIVLKTFNGVTIKMSLVSVESR